jgi:hypothetical protein
MESFEESEELPSNPLDPGPMVDVDEAQLENAEISSELDFRRDVSRQIQLLTEVVMEMRSDALRTANQVLSPTVSTPARTTEPRLRVREETNFQIQPRRMSTDRRDSSDFTVLREPVNSRSDVGTLQFEDIFEEKEDFNPKENPIRPRNLTTQTRRSSMINEARRLDVDENRMVNYRQVESSVHIQ